MIGGVLNVVQRQRIPFGSGPLANLDLDFTTDTYQLEGTSYAFQDLIRFSRTSAGTFTGSNGLIQNSPISRNSLLWTQEPDNAWWAKAQLAVQSNLLLRSQEYDNASWTKNTTTITANAIAAPDGTTSAEKLIPDNTAPFTSSYIRQNISKAAAALTYITSIYAKAGEFNRVRLFVRDNAAGTNSASVTVSLLDGSIVSAAAAIGTFTNASATVTDAGGGWYRIALTFTTGTETTIWGQSVFAEDSVATTGDGTSGIYAWGSQLTAGSTPASYTSTLGATVATSFASPTGLLDANLLVEDVATANHTLTATAVSMTAGLPYTFSVYAKANGRSIQLALGSGLFGGTQTRVWYNLNTGTVDTINNAAATITSVGDGWYRCSMTVVPSGSGTVTPQIGLNNTSSGTFYAGNGSSGAYIWGAQLEAGDASNITLGSENLSGGTIGLVGTATAATYDTGTGVGSVTRVDASNQSFVRWPSQTFFTRIDVSCTTGSIDIRSGTQTGTIVATIAAGASQVAWVGGTFTITSTSAATSTFTVNSVKQVSAFTSLPTSYVRNADGRYEPRFDYDPVTLEAKGLLIEEQRTNLLVRSEEFDNTATWLISASSVTVTADATTSPDGTTDADKLIVANGVVALTTTYLYTNISKASVATTYTFSCYAKEAEYDVFRVLINDNSNSSNFALGAWSLVDGSVNETIAASGTFTNASGTATAVGNGWYRITLTFTSSTETVLRVRIYPRDSSGVVTGDGVSGIYIWGAQLETGAFASSYIPTAASTVTRAADIALITGGAFSPWYNPLEGTLSAEIIPQLSNAANQFIASVSDGTNTNRAAMFKATSGFGGFRTTSGGAAGNPGAPASPLTGNVAHKIALGFTTGTNNVMPAVNGMLGVPATLSRMPSGVNTLRFGVNEVATADWMNGHTRRFRYYNTRLTDAQLQTVTT